MSWSAPITKAVGDPLTASDWNTYVRDNESALYGDSWATPTFLNSWAVYNAAYPVAYRKVGSSCVLRGLIASGTIGSGTPAFVLPAGYRPSTNQIFVVASNDAFGEVRVDATTGNVACTVGSNVWVSLDGIWLPLV